MRMNKKSKEKLGDGIYSLKEAGTADFVLYFLKINFMHVFFEVLFAVLFITLMVFYSPLVVSDSEKIQFSVYFGRVLFTCGIIFLILTVIFIFAISIIAMYYITGENVKRDKKNNADEKQKGIDLKANLQKKETYEKAIKNAINWGLAAHIIIGLITAAFPSFFTGIEEVHFDNFDRLLIGSAIFLFGLGGFTLSWLRSKRVNWNEVIKNSTNEHSDETDKLNEIDKYNQYINTLSFTILSAIAQVIAACIIIVSFARVFMYLIPAGNGFDYYNLMLAIVFAVISTYITMVYKKEFFGDDMPGFAIKPCKNPRSNENSSAVHDQQMSKSESTLRLEDPK